MTDTIPIGIRLAPEYRDTLRLIAAQEGRTMSSMASRMVVEGIRRWQDRLGKQEADNDAG